MADSVSGIPVFTLANLRVKSAGANVVGAVTDGDGDSVVLRTASRPYATVSVAVSDHPADGGDGEERAIFVNKTLNGSWELGDSKLGTAVVTGASGTAVGGRDIVIPI